MLFDRFDSVFKEKAFIQMHFTLLLLTGCICCKMSLGYPLFTVLDKFKKKKKKERKREKKEKKRLNKSDVNALQCQSPVSCWSRWLISQPVLTLILGKDDCALACEVLFLVKCFEFYDSKVRRGSSEVQRAKQQTGMLLHSLRLQAQHHTTRNQMAGLI